MNMFEQVTDGFFRLNREFSSEVLCKIMLLVMNSYRQHNPGKHLSVLVGGSLDPSNTLLLADLSQLAATRAVVEFHSDTRVITGDQIAFNIIWTMRCSQEIVDMLGSEVFDNINDWSNR